jgi:hypothetical protein
MPIPIDTAPPIIHQSRSFPREEVTRAPRSSAVYEALTQQKQPQQALTEMAGQLTQIIRDG